VHEDSNRVEAKKYQEIEDVEGESVDECAQRWWDLSKTRDDSIVTDNFGGQFLKWFRCKNCNNISRNCDSFLSVNLSLPAHCNTVEQCLDAQFGSTQVEDYKCLKCKESSMESYSGFYRLPKILVIILDRFEANGLRMNKLNKSIDIPLQLQLGK